MLRTFLLKTILLLFIPIQGICAFSCFYRTGDVRIEHKGSLLPFHRGDMFEKGRLLIGPGSSVVLVDNRESILRLDDPGLYSIGQCRKLFRKSKKSILSKYLSFVVKNIWKKKKTEELHAVAGVSRADGPIVKSPVDGEWVYDDTLRFSWSATGSDTVYFSLFDPGSRLLEKRIVTDSSLKVTGSNFQAKPGKYRWTVSTSGFRMAESGFEFSIPGEQEKENFFIEKNQFMGRIDYKDPVDILLLVDWYRSHLAYTPALRLLNGVEESFGYELVEQYSGYIRQEFLITKN